MEKFWTPLSWNWDRNSLEYLSSIEAISYPFIGVQFHPEKNIYEWSSREPRIPHSKYANIVFYEALEICFIDMPFTFPCTSPLISLTWPGEIVIDSQAGRA